MSAVSSRTVVTVGTFDGVHLGHAALVERAREIAGPRGRVVAVALDPHPRSVLRPGSEPPRLTTFGRRAELLLEAGANEVRRLEPTPDVRGLSAAAFMAELAHAFRPVALVEGGDFRFGRGREGDAGRLALIGRDLGFEVDIVGDIEAELTDQTLVKVSSTLVRWLLVRGRVADAAALLGRPYELAGEVIRGDRRGRAAGFATVNIAAETLRPADGVYAATAQLPAGRVLPAAVNIGTRPTVDGHDHRVEAHILGLPTSWHAGRGDRTPAAAWQPIEGLDEYGWLCELSVHAWLRDQMRFASFDELTAQLARDCGRVLDVLRQRAPGHAIAAEAGL